MSGANQLDKVDMLPWLKRRIPPVMKVAVGGEVKDDEGLREAAADLLRAIHEEDLSGIANALQAAFEICDSYPHEEGEHLEE